jgi:hypothetical protein
MGGLFVRPEHGHHVSAHHGTVSRMKALLNHQRTECACRTNLFVVAQDFADAGLFKGECFAE